MNKKRKHNDDNATLKNSRTYYDKLFEILAKTDKLELVSVSSLTGFIFKVTTNEVKPKSYIMKIVVLEPNNTDKRISLSRCIETVPSLNNEKKITETEKDFRYEGEIQEYIHNKSIISERQSICPSIDYAVIYKKNISNDFLTMLKNINNTNNTQSGFNILSNSSPEIKEVIDCLLFYFTNKFNNEKREEYFFRLGIILMDEIPNCVTFYDFIHNNKNSKIDNDDKKLAYSYIYYQLIYLFLFIGIINFDMHMDNALVYFDIKDDGKIKSKLIDFGKVDNLNDRDSNKYLSSGEKDYINTIRNSLNEKVLNIMFPKKEYYTDQDKINFIMKTMNIINIICWAVNRKKYNYNRPTIHQMDWFKPIPKVIEYMVNSITNDVNSDNTVNTDKSIDGDPMKALIKNLMEKTDYSTTDINNVDPKKSFDILERNTKTISTNNMNLKYREIKEIDSNVIKSDPECKKYGDDDNGDEINDNDGICVIMGGRKTRKSKRKYKTKFYIKSGKKSKIKTKRKSQKKSSRKTKKTHIK
jgi:hypothetical protein